MKNCFRMVGYLALTVAGLYTAASSLSLGFIPDTTVVGTTATLVALALCLIVAAVWSGLWPAHAVGLLLCNHKTPAQPREGAR